MRKSLDLVSLFIFCAIAMQPEARALSTPWVQDIKQCTGTVAGTNGTLTCDFPVPTDRVAYLDAICAISDLNSSHLHGAALLRAEYVLENKNGTLAAATAFTSSNNPTAAGTTVYVAAHAQAADSDFVGGGPSNCAWSISTTNARLTVTNAGATSGDATLLIKALVFGSQ